MSVNPNYLEAETFVAFPYSSNLSAVEGVPTPVLSRLSQFSLAATIELVHQAEAIGNKPHLLIIGETGYDGLPSTANLMFDEAIRAYEGLAGRITLMDRTRDNAGPQLNNTNQQIKAISYYAGEHSGSVVAVPMRYHKPRTSAAAYEKNVKLGLVAAEDILSSPQDRVPFQPYFRYFPKPGQYASEELLGITNWVPGFSALVNFATKIRGARMVDVMKLPGTDTLGLRSITCDERYAEVMQEIAAQTA